MNFQIQEPEDADDETKLPESESSSELSSSTGREVEVSSEPETWLEDNCTSAAIVTESEALT
ncbi:MAG: hypothetical protein R2741_09795 [Methanolobus sp.]